MNLSIAFLNDVHAYLEPHNELLFSDSGPIFTTAGGYAKISTLVNEIRAKNPNTLVFDGGDTFHGTLPAVQSQGECLIPILNKIGFDAMVAHWDFAYGSEQLLKIGASINHPILGINVYKDDGSLLLQPYKLIDVDGIKVAVIGICSFIIDKTMPPKFSKGLKFTTGRDELPGRVAEVKSAGADIIILMSHNGFPQDVALLKEVPGIDVCLSAHTHNRLHTPEIINDCLIIQCGCHGSFLGELNLEIENGLIVKHEYRLIPVSSDIADDESVQKLVQTTMAPYREMQENIVGRTTVPLSRYDTLNSHMDSLLLQAILDASGTEVAFSNGWRYGAPIPAGDISEWDLYNIIPMNPVVSTVDLTGKEIKKMLEENLERTFSAEPFEQMGGYVKRAIGMRAYMRIENPKGMRIQELFINDLPVEPLKKYRTAFVTSQGVPEKLGTNRVDLEITAIDAIKSFLAKNGPFADVHPVFSLV